jgi:hypothetical protein
MKRLKTTGSLGPRLPFSEVDKNSATLLVEIMTTRFLLQMGALLRSGLTIGATSEVSRHQ